MGVYDHFFFFFFLDTLPGVGGSAHKDGLNADIYVLDSHNVHSRV